MEDDGREAVDRPVAPALEDQPHLLPDDALAIIELVGEKERLAGEEQQPKRAEAEQAESGEQGDAPGSAPLHGGFDGLHLHRAGRARTSICLPSGFTGDFKYAPISGGQTGSRDLTVSGRKRGRTSMTSQPLAARKSARLTWDQIETWV